MNRRSATEDAVGALVVVPGRPGRSRSVESRLLAADGLASGLASSLGSALVATSDGVAAPGSLSRSAVHDAVPSPRRSLARRLPAAARVALGDVRAWLDGRRAVPTEGWGRPGLVVQYHHRFHDAGLQFARAIGARAVLRIEALEVREERTWGVRRPGWGALVERRGELRLLGMADVVVPVSEEVDAQIGALGVPAQKRLVLPNGVDAAAFLPGARSGRARREIAGDAELVVGWVGGFRPFHGLDLVPDLAVALLTRGAAARIVLIGTGPMEDHVARATGPVRDVVSMLGPVPAHDMPGYVASFDVGLLLGREDVGHYSPMKLYEYMASGVPVVAPQVGQVARVVTEAHAGVLVPHDDPRAIADAIARLADDGPLRSRLGANGRAWILRHATWTRRAEALVRFVSELSGRAPGPLLEDASH
jgi:glycosyltransferase involved in cell wall biosynthesis